MLEIGSVSIVDIRDRFGINYIFNTTRRNSYVFEFLNINFS